MRANLDHTQLLCRFQHMLLHVLESSSTLKGWRAIIRPGGFLTFYFPHCNIYIWSQNCVCTLTERDTFTDTQTQKNKQVQQSTQIHTDRRHTHTLRVSVCMCEVHIHPTVPWLHIWEHSTTFKKWVLQLTPQRLLSFPLLPAAVCHKNTIFLTDDLK